MTVRSTKCSHGWRWTGYIKKKKCERCPRKYGLVVHHKDRDKSNNKDHANLETLCRSCHVKEHHDEIAESQRRDDVNERRGASVSRSKKGRSYPNNLKAVWGGAAGEALRRKLKERANTDEVRHQRSETAQRLMSDPGHIAKRKAMKEARRAAANHD